MMELQQQDQGKCTLQPQVEDQVFKAILFCIRVHFPYVMWSMTAECWPFISVVSQ